MVLAGSGLIMRVDSGFRRFEDPRDSAEHAFIYSNMSLLWNLKLLFMCLILGQD